MKKYVFIIFILFLFSLSGCKKDDDLTLKKKEIYIMAKDVGYEGTFEEWLDSIKGEQGIPGKNVELSLDGSYIKWKNSGETTWYELISINEFKGDKGKGITNSKINDMGELVITYSDNTTENLGTIFRTNIVQFVDYDGHIIDFQHVIYGGSAYTQVTPNRPGYKFVGWDKEFNQVYKDVRINAVYEPIYFSVTLYKDKGNFFNQFNATYQTIINLPTPTRNGYDFVGWYNENGTLYTNDSKINGNTNLYAKWEEKTYYVTFLDNEGNLLSKQNVKHGYTAIEPKISEIPGYSFEGWSENFLEVKTDLIVKPNYKANIYFIKFEVNGGIPFPNLPIQYGSTLSSLPTPRRKGYEFLGWYLDSMFLNEFAATTMPINGITVYAKWEFTGHMIYFDAAGGEDISPMIVENGEEINQLPETYKTGYEFKGWLLNGEPISFPYYYTLEEDMYLTAEWELSTYSIGYVTDTSGYDPVKDIVLSFNGPIKQVSADTFNTMLLTMDGRVFTWGGNSTGILGDNSTIDKLIPTEITHNFNLKGNEIIIQISTGTNHAAALTSKGRMFTWGANASGQLGNGNTIRSLLPIDITDKFKLNIGETIVKVECGVGFSAAITSEGRLFTWGYNSSGQLGNGTKDEKSLPQDITKNFNLNTGEYIKNIESLYNSIVITSDGRVFTWGYNLYGQLGDNTTVTKLLPVDITDNFSLENDEKVISVTYGYVTAGAVTSKGRVFTWGYNELGQLGSGDSSTGSIVPLDITNNFNLNADEYIKQVTFGGFHALAISSTDRIFTWGYNKYYQLGSTNTENSLYPIDVSSNFTIMENDQIIEVELGSYHTTLITSAGRMYSVGGNESGQIGDGTNIDKQFIYKNDFYHPEAEVSYNYKYDENIAEYIPTKSGYTFVGWYEDINLTIPFTSKTMLAKDITLYAKFEMN